MLYCAGQAAINAQGWPVGESMATQLELGLANLSQVISQAGYSPGNIVRLNLHTTDMPKFFEAYGVLAGWIAGYGIRPASTLIEVKALAFPGLTAEIEVTAVR